MTCQLSQPAKVGRPCYDRMKIVNDFVQWARSNSDAWTVPQFATAIGINSKMMNEWAAVDDEFSVAFTIGKELIGINRLKASITQPGQEKPLMDRSTYLRGIGNYDCDINIYERGERKFDIECKANIDKENKFAVNEETATRQEKMMDQISELQSSLSKANSSIKSEEKS